MFKIQNVISTLKLALPVVIVGFLLLPVQFYIFIFAWMSMGSAYEIILHQVFGEFAPSGGNVNIWRSVEFLFTAFGIHLFYAIIYSIISFFVEKKTECFLLAILVFNVLFSIIALDLRRPRAEGLVPTDIDYHIAYAFLFAMIMFTVFTLIMRLLDRNIDWGKWKIVLSSFFVSSFLGSVLSIVVWVVLFIIFHGFTVTSF